MIELFIKVIVKVIFSIAIEDPYSDSTELVEVKLQGIRSLSRFKRVCAEAYFSCVAGENPRPLENSLSLIRMSFSKLSTRGERRLNGQEGFSLYFGGGSGQSF
jgi:hypothetical protein